MKWKWQLMIAAPLAPWIYLEYVNFLASRGQYLGMGEIGSWILTIFLTFAATIMFFCGYSKYHGGWE